MKNPGVFKEYAGFYDLFYSGKDYRAEAAFALELAASHSSSGKPSSLLDMGCGTGRHLREFSKAGLECCGFDISKQMLASAKENLKGLPASLSQGDLRSYRDGRKYDLAVSMFAVMGYLTGNEDLLAGLKTAAVHLKPGGLFIFDGWFGPAVLSQKPEVRLHNYTNEDGAKVFRRAEPALDCQSQTVEVRYTIGISDPRGGVQEFQETHRMRYFFVQEIELAMRLCGLKLLAAMPFMMRNCPLSPSTWNVSFVSAAL